MHHATIINPSAWPVHMHHRQPKRLASEHAPSSTRLFSAHAPSSTQALGQFTCTIVNPLDQCTRTIVNPSAWPVHMHHRRTWPSLDNKIIIIICIRPGPGCWIVAGQVFTGKPWGLGSGNQLQTSRYRAKTCLTLNPNSEAYPTWRVGCAGHYLHKRWPPLPEHRL